MIQEFDTRSVLSDMIREVNKMDEHEFSKDSSSLRNYSQFFLEVAETHPKLFIPSLPILLPFLHQEVSQNVDLFYTLNFIF